MRSIIHQIVLSRKAFGAFWKSSWQYKAQAREYPAKPFRASMAFLADFSVPIHYGIHVP